MAKVNYLYLLNKYKFHSDAVEVQLDNLSNELSISNRHINELGQQNSKLQMELLTKEKYISLADEQLLSVKQTVASQNSSIYELTAKCCDHKRLQIVINEQNALITRLKEELSIFTSNHKTPNRIDVLLKNNQEMEATLIQKNIELAKLQLKDKEIEIDRLKATNAKLTESNESYLRKLSELKIDGHKKKMNNTSNFFLLADDLSQTSSNLIMDFSYGHASGDEGTISDEGLKLQDTVDESDMVFSEVSKQTNIVNMKTESKSMIKASNESNKSRICPKNRVRVASKACEENDILKKSVSFAISNSPISKVPRHTPIVREYLNNEPLKVVKLTSFNENKALPAVTGRTLKSSVNHRISVLKSKCLKK